MSLLSPRFNTGTYAVTRPVGAGTTDPTSGIYTPPVSTTTLQVPACVQNLSGRELKDLPEGRRANDYRMVLTNVPLYTVQPATALVPQMDVPDVISIEGEAYRVIMVKKRSVLSGHYRATVERIAIP